MARDQEREKSRLEVDLRRKSKRKASSWFLLSVSRSPVPGCSRSPSVFLTLGSVRAYHLIVLVFFGYAGSLQLCAGFLQLQRVRATLQLWCMGFCRCRAQALGCSGFSACGAQAQQLKLPALECRLNSCGPWAQLLLGMWYLPGSGIESVSPALAAVFFTSEPPEKPPK